MTVVGMLLLETMFIIFAKLLNIKSLSGKQPVITLAAICVWFAVHVTFALLAASIRKKQKEKLEMNSFQIQQIQKRKCRNTEAWIYVKENEVLEKEFEAIL